MRFRDGLGIGVRLTACVLIIGLGASIALAPRAVDAATDREVGVTSVVNTKAEGTPPAADTRVLATGTKMYFEEKVVTNATGRAQFLFADGSSMTVGPNSDLVIDTFIYNPDTKVGDMTVSLTKGFVRFVGGRISKRKPVKIKTPIGSIGIRGGIAMVEMQPGQGMTADFLFGTEMTMEVGENVQTTTSPGTFMTAAGGAGGAVSAPARRQASDLNRRLKSFESQGDSNDQGSDNNEQGGNQASNSGGGQQGQQSSGGQGDNAQGSNNQASNDQESDDNQGGSAGGTQGEGDQSTQATLGGTDGAGGTETDGAGNQVDATAPGGTQTGSDTDGIGALPGGGGGSNDQLALIDTGISGLAESESGGLDAPDISSAPAGAGGGQGGTTSLPSDSGGSLVEVLEPVVETPQPRPEEEQTATLIPTPEPTPEPVPEPTPEPPIVTPVPTPTPEPTPPVVVVAPEPEPEPAPPAATPFTRSFTGFALRGGASFPTLGANVTSNITSVTDRRFSSVTVSGADDTVGGRMTASSTAGAYGLFYPAPTAASPVNMSACGGGLDCSSQLAGVTPTTVAGPIEFSADPDFVVYALNVDSEKSLIALGTEFTGSTPTTGAARYSVRPDSFLAGGLPFLRSTDTGFPAANDTDLYAKWSTSAGSVPFMASRFEIDGAGGKSSISVMMGSIAISSDPFLDGVMVGQVDQTGAAVPEMYEAGVFSADTDSGKDFFGSSGPDHFVLTSIGDADIGAGEFGVENVDLAPATIYYPVNAVSKAGSHTVNASNTQLAGVALVGYYGGAGTVAGTPGAHVATTPADPSFLSISLSTDLPITNIDVTPDGGSTTVTADDSGGFGAYVDDGNFATEITTGATSGGGAEATATIGYLVTGGNNSASFDLCSACEFLSWGFWGQEQLTNDVVFHMASWVAGVATNFGTLGALTASGTYNGNVVGSIIDTGATAVKTGNFSLDVSLAGASSTATLNSFNFDGASFTTGATGFDATSQYYTLTDTVGGKTLDMRGAFFGVDGANIPPETGGDFKINGTGYTAAGVFAARK